MWSGHCSTETNHQALSISNSPVSMSATVVDLASYGLHSPKILSVVWIRHHTKFVMWSLVHFCEPCEKYSRVDVKYWMIFLKIDFYVVLKDGLKLIMWKIVLRMYCVNTGCPLIRMCHQQGFLLCVDCYLLVLLWYHHTILAVTWLVSQRYKLLPWLPRPFNHKH